MRPSPPPRLYRRLAAEARRVARLFDGGAAALEKIAESPTGSRAHNSATAGRSLEDTSASPRHSAPRPCSPSSATCAATASTEAITRRLRGWVEGGPLQHDCDASGTPLTAYDAWLVDAVASAAAAQRGSTGAADPHARSSTAEWDSDSVAPCLAASVSDAEKSVANVVASRMRLPPRFYWPSPAFSSSCSSTAPASPADPPTAASLPPAQASLMLWPTGMRTTSGGIAARPPAASAATSMATAAPLTALPALASAEQLFASTKSKPAGTAAARSPTTAATSLSSPPPPRHRSPAMGGGARGASTDGMNEAGRAGSGSGGGAVYASMLEAYAVLLHTARTQAITRGAGQVNAFAGSEAEQQQRQRLALYCSDQCDALLVRAAQLLGITHVRVLQTVAAKHELPLPDARGTPARETCAVYNYALDLRQVQARLVEDVAAGLYPLMVVGTFGSALSGSVDPVAALAAFCQRLGVWFHLDASHGGTALLAQAERGVPLTPPCAALQAQFHAAAALADSVLVPAGCSSALPYAPLPTRACGDGGADVGAAALFMADTRKLAWSVQALGEARHHSMNQAITPRVCDSDVLRVAPLANVADWLQRLHIASILMPADALARRVGAHQGVAQSVLQAVRGDGRFDAALDAAAFGLVHLRWLTAADEATVRLAEVWQRVLVHAEADGADGSAIKGGSVPSPPQQPPPPPLQLRVRLVQLQRRVWVALSFGPVSCEGRPGSDTDAVAYVLRTLHAAASEVEPSATAGAASRPALPASHDCVTGSRR